MILTILGIILLVIVVISFINIRVGTALYLSYSILVPISDVTIGTNLHIGENIIRSILILALLFDFKVKNHYKLRWKLVLPFILYYVIEIVIIPFQYETPVSWMFTSWRQSLMNTLFGTFVIYNVMIMYPKSIKLFRNSFIVSIVAAALYGLFLTSMDGLNPYILSIVSLKGDEEDVDYLMKYFSTDDRLFGRISSVFRHPMTFGLFLGLAFIYIFSIRNKIKKLPMALILVLLSIDALFCGVRSCIGGLVIAVAFYLLFSRNIKVGLITLVVGLIAYNLILQMPELSDYVGTIVDVNNSQNRITGSSFEMRLSQLNGCFTEIQNNPILGKGFGWHKYYQDTYGNHPTIYAFESLIFVVLCDSGILGIIIWIGLIILVIRNNHKLKLNDPIVSDALLVYYIAYSCITGEYGYMQYYLLFYICLVAENRITNNNNNKVAILNHV